MWAEKQLTEEEAINFNDIKAYENLTYKEKFEFQLFQERLCMPFDVFHEAAEKTLNRPVWTREFAFHDRMVKEYLGEREKPTIEDIISLIPEEKRIIIFK
jgi:hypothetical protein